MRQSDKNPDTSLVAILEWCIRERDRVASAGGEGTVNMFFEVSCPTVWPSALTAFTCAN